MPIPGRFVWHRVLQRAAFVGCLGLGVVACSSEADEPNDLEGAAGTSVLPAGGASAGGASGAAGATSSAGAGGASTMPASGAGGSAGAATAGVGGVSAGGGGGSGGIGGSTGTGGSAPDLSGLEPFSFFVTSYAAMVRLSGSEKGFGGDLRYGEADGLSGADKICTEIAETSMPGSGAKVWHAFLSVTKGADGTPVNAIDRLGDGPWYDRIGRLLAMNKAALMNTRPEGADPAIIDDFPNEDGVPNHAPDGTLIDNHDFLTGTNAMGQVFCTDATCTCSDWTSAEPTGKPRVGHAWPRNAGPGGVPGGFGGGFAGTDGGFGGTGGLFPGGFDPAHWMSSLDEAGCAPGIEGTMGFDGPPDPNIPTVGSGGGYGGIYCFAMNP